MSEDKDLLENIQDDKNEDISKGKKTEDEYEKVCFLCRRRRVRRDR